MPLPAARVDDIHFCPHHGLGATTAPGCTTVQINQRDHAGATKPCHCDGPANFIVTGSSTVLIEGQPAARVVDKTMHGPGLVLRGSADVLIGGPSIGVSMGGGDGALDECEMAAKGRASGDRKQSYDNCGVETARQIIRRATGAEFSEDELLEDAVAHGDAKDGGTTTTRTIAQILARHGVPTSRQPQTPDGLMGAVGEGKGVITGHDAGRLYAMEKYDGLGHAVVMTGVRFDESGRPIEVFVNDSGAGTCGRAVPADRFFGSLLRSNAIVTDTPIW